VHFSTRLATGRAFRMLVGYWWDVSGVLVGHWWGFSRDLVGLVVGLSGVASGD
jgi:hypothetical protein